MSPCNWLRRSGGVSRDATDTGRRGPLRKAASTSRRHRPTRDCRSGIRLAARVIVDLDQRHFALTATRRRVVVGHWRAASSKRKPRRGDSGASKVQNSASTQGRGRMSCRTLDSKRGRAALVPRHSLRCRIKFAAGVRGISMQFNAEHSPRLAHCPRSRRSSDANTICKNLPLDWESRSRRVGAEHTRAPAAKAYRLAWYAREIDGTESSNLHPSGNEMRFEVE